MAHPASSHRDRDDDRGTTRERTHRSSSAHHHHRTISSTTLLLVLSLILAVLAVMLSLPSRSGSGGVLPTSRTPAAQATPEADTDNALSHSFWGYLTPRRSHALVLRESEVARREAEVARREAELLIGRPSSHPLPCPICGETVIEEEYESGPSVSLVSRASRPAPPQATHTVYKEVVKEVEPTNPAWLQQRIEGLVEREMKISDREKEVGKREETVGRRESDATKREGWISEQLHVGQEIIEEDYVHDHDHPRHYYGEARRSPPKTVVVTETATETKIVPPPPATTRIAARPTPETFIRSASGAGSGKTREIFYQVPTDAIIVDVPKETVTVVEKITSRPRRKWFGGRW